MSDRQEQKTTPVAPSRERTRTRHERQARKRRRRARAHLQKVSRRGQHATEIQQRIPLRPAGRGWNAFVGILFSAFVLAGVLGAQPLARAGLEWWNQAVPHVDRVAIRGHRHLDARDVALTSGIERSAGIETLEIPKIVEKLVSHDWIAEAEILLLPSGTALIGVSERRPRAIVFASGDTQGSLVDAAGTPFASAAPEDLANPNLVRLRISAAAPRQVASPALSRATALAEAIQALAIDRLAFAELAVPSPASSPNDGEPPGWTLRSADGGLEVRLGPDEGEAMVTRLGYLQRLFAADLFEEPARGRIDLRFGEQAVLRASLRPSSPGADPLIRPRDEAGNTRRQGADASGRPNRGSPGEPVPLGGNHG